ncbi:MAG: ABC transporter permease [Candidatus Omnitrophica bacterium]|nr:ABC transporter permease [Candidatus Omnitrophota bacterium]
MQDKKTIITTYQPDNSLKTGYLSIFDQIFKEIIKNRWLTWQLFKRDFLTMYKQSFIGILWTLILPAVSIVTFLILNKSGIFNIGQMQMPYPIYAICGIAYWQIFACGLINGVNSLVKAGPMIVKINFSKKSLVIAATAQSLVSFVIQIIILIFLLMFYGIRPPLTIVLFPLLALPVFLFTLGFSFVMSLLNGIMRDVGNIISILMSFLFFLTPVLYLKPQWGILADLSRINPLYHLVAGARELIITGAIESPMGIIVSTVIALGVFIISIVIFHMTETRVAERI